MPSISRESIVDLPDDDIYMWGPNYEWIISWNDMPKTLYGIPVIVEDSMTSDVFTPLMQQFLDDLRGRGVPDAFLAEAAAIIVDKGADYTISADRLDNFKRAAAQLGVSPKLIWLVYAFKHWSAIVSWASGKDLKSEPIRGRFLDLANYCGLGTALEVENY